MNKKGGFGEFLGIGVALFIFIIVAFIFIIIAGVFLNGFGKISGELTNLPGTYATNKNISDVTQTTFGNLDAGFQTLRWVTFVVIFGMILGIFITALLVKVHPAYFGLYILFAVFSILISIFLANSYDALRNTPQLSGTFSTFVGSNWILANLPVVMTVVSLLGAIFIFMSITRDPEQGGVI